MAWSIPWQLMGMEVSGDVGDLTIYTDRFGKKVAFPKAPPKEPPSFAQIIQRQRFADGQKFWSALNDDEKAALELATKKVSAPLTGQNLYISTYIRNDSADLLTFEKQSGVRLPARIPRIPVGKCEIKPTVIICDGDKKKEIQARAITDTVRCRRRIDYAVAHNYPGNFVGAVKNDWKWRAGHVDYLHLFGPSVHTVLFSFTVTFGCGFEVEVGRIPIFE